MSCALIAREKQEDPAGTAVHIKRWICLEIPQGWLPRFKLHDLNISQELKESIQKGLDVPQTRLQLIRGNRVNRTGYIAFVCDETGLYMCHVEDIQEWSQYDWTDFSSFSICSRELTLICTHGSRDACCGTMGGRLYKGLIDNQKTPSNIPTIWQTSHLGGHRFAPTILQFPRALVSAFIEIEDLITNPTDQLPIQKWRGCSFYSPAAQFADIYLRKNQITPLTCKKDQILDDITSVHWIGEDSHGEQNMYSFEIERKGIGVFAKASCKDDVEKELRAFFILSESQTPYSITQSPLK